MIPRHCNGAIDWSTLAVFGYTLLVVLVVVAYAVSLVAEAVR